MNIAKIIKNLTKVWSDEYIDKITDTELGTALQIILNKFSDDQFQHDSVELDIYWKSSFGSYNYRPWCENPNHDPIELSPEKELYEYKKAAKKLEPLCKKLRKFGFKCKVIARTTKKEDGQILVHTPWIEVKV
jgi:hypothetical protein